MSEAPVSVVGSPLELQRLVARLPATRNWRDALLRRMLAGADAAAVLVAVGFFGLVAGDWRFALWFGALLPFWLLLSKLVGLYDNDHRALRHLTVDELPQLLMWTLLGSLLARIVLNWVPGADISVGRRVEMLGIVLAAAFGFRALARFAWRRTVPPERTMIVGDGPLADAVRRKIQLFPDVHVALVGPRPDLEGADRIILATPQIDEAQIADLVGVCRERQIKLSVVPPARGMFGTAVQLKHVADLPVLEYNTWDVSRSTLALKRVLDVAFSLPTVIVLSPLFVAIALAIAVDSRGPIVIGQRRAGVGGRSFRMYKFRTMVSDAAERLPVSIEDLPEPMFKLPDDPRVTRVGRLLRRTSLDELPQLFNVLRGDMSLVGPRPEEVELVEQYEPEHRFRLAVKPGMTGPMQVYGRGKLSFEERLAVEREYVDNLSVSRDMRILALTVAAVFSGRGAY